MLQAGDADNALAGSPADWPQLDTLVGEECQLDDRTDCTEIDPELPLTRIMGLVATNRTDMFFTFNINTEGGNNLVGSGMLDGNGIPANFFSDPHVRKGFAYCFNYDAYAEDVMQGEAIRSNNVMLPGMIGYQEDFPLYTYDPEKCAAELQLSKWTDNGDGTYTPDENGAISLWDTGFRFTAAYNTGNTARQTMAQILQTELSTVNDKFVVEVTGLPWASFLRNQRASNLPIFFSGWQEDIHDPHNWVQPFTYGTYGGRQRMPDELKAQFQEIANRGVAATDLAEREAIYAELNQLHYDTAASIPMYVLTSRRYQQRWVDGWFYNPIFSGTYYYTVTKK
jgi:peptide/nickel transport system substrate-binding protein